MPSLATFNANNFFLRYKFAKTYPNDMSKASLIEASEVGAKGYLPGIAFGRYTKNYIVWDPVRRQQRVAGGVADRRDGVAWAKRDG